MLVLSNANYSAYRNILSSTEGGTEALKCLKCLKELPDYNKITVLKQSETVVTNKYRLCDNCNDSNKFHSPLNGRWGI